MSGRSKSMRERLTESIRKKPDEPQELNYGNIVVLGQEKVGKTSLISRFVNNYFSENYIPTSSQSTYEVVSLIQCEKDDDEKGEKKKMVMKKSFKKSVMGTSRPLKPKTTMKRVLTVNRSGGQDISRQFAEGKAKGLKEIRFNLIDTPAEMPEMEPISYQATLANAKGFLLMCSFDVEGSVEYVKERFAEIKKQRNIDDTPVLIVANKYDLDEKAWDEYEINTLAAQLKVKYCVSSIATPEGCEEMQEKMLNEINVFATEEAFQASLPEDYAYFDKPGKEVGIGSF